MRYVHYTEADVVTVQGILSGKKYCIYEDMLLGNLSRERYQKMAEGYKAEQASLNNEIIGLDDWVATREEMEDNHIIVCSYSGTRQNNGYEILKK